MYRIELRRKVQLSIDKLPGRDFDAVIDKIKNLADSPRPRGVEKIKSTGLWRVRQGDYRIVYNINDKQQIITIVRIGHRREVYRGL